MTTSGNHKKHMLKPGQVLNGRWEILEHIATGGKGEVYLARQPKLEREVAVKVVSQDLIDAYEGDEEEIAGEMERFRREVLAMAATRHPNVLQVYDFEQSAITVGGREKTIDYIVMEYIPGETLSATIPEQGLANDEDGLRAWITKYFLPVLDGVEHIHVQGIVHRDLKPSNVMLDGEVPKISDFGLVGGGQWKPVTRSHHVMGTLAYMAPEQYMDLAEAGFRADIYSLGKMLYKATVGGLGKDTMKPLQTASLPRADTPLLKALDRVIRKATAEGSDRRYASVDELREALVKLPGLVPAGGVGRRKLALALGLAAVLAALLVWGVWYHFNMPQVKKQAPTQPPIMAQEGSRTPEGPPAQKIISQDGAVLRMIPAGEALLEGRRIGVKPFYLAETRTTNHQYVEFLNAIKGNLSVNQGVVKLGGKPLLRLGEVRKGIAPIAYRKGRFRITDPKYASHPVLLVSGHGALAFASHYGLRLPTVSELLRSGWGRKQEPSEKPGQGEGGEQGMAAMHGQMTSAPPQPSATEDGYWPVTHWPANSVGIRGMEAVLGEWVTAADGKPDLLVLFEISREAEPFLAKRPPWESFGWVGFRCARNLASMPDGS